MEGLTRRGGVGGACSMPTCRCGVEIFGFFDGREADRDHRDASIAHEIAKLIGELPPDDRVDLLDEVEPKVVERVDAADPRRRAPRHPAAERLSRGHGRRGDDHRVRPAAARTCTVGQALEEIGRQAERAGERSTTSTWSTRRTICGGWSRPGSWSPRWASPRRASAT